MLSGRKRVYAAGSGRARSQSAKKSKTAPKVRLGSLQPSRTSIYHCQLRYSDTYALNPGVTGAATQVLTANGLFDVDTTGVGHQPAGYDELMALWSEYIVVRSRIKVVVSGSLTAGNGGATVGVALLDKSTTGDWNKYIENGHCAWTKQGGNQTDPVTLTNYVDMRKYTNQDIFTADEYAGGTAGNPDDTHYWHLFIQTDNSTDTGSYYFTVEVCYDVYFRDPSFTALS